MTLFILGVLIALIVSTVCSVMEATLLSLTPAQVANLAQSRPRIGRIWQRFKSEVERPIAVILLLNTAAHTVGASVAGAQFGEVFGEQHLWLFATAFTYVMLQFTEILAKSLGVRFNRALAPLIARPLQISEVALRPVLWFIYLINKPFEARGDQTDSPATIEEIAALAGLARIARQITPHQERIIAEAPRLSEYHVRDIQIPLADVAWLEASATLEEAIRQARRHLHTRFPVCEAGDLDRVIGYVNVKEMLFLATDPTSDSLQRLPLRPILAVSEDDSAADVLATFTRERAHVAIVRNAAEETTGLITLEDIVEELLGDIRDEFDRLPRHVHPTGEGRWLVGGGIRMQVLATTLHVELPAAADQTLSVWLEDLVDGPIQVGSSAEAHGLLFTVRRLRRGSLYECEIRRVGNGGSGAASSLVRRDSEES